MTREEAIKELEILKEEYWDDDGYGHETKQYDDTMLALDMAISDMEKQIPKKPEPIDYTRYVGVVRNAHYLRNRSWCPNCHTDINSGRYCVNCGQLLDWSDEK